MPTQPTLVGTSVAPSMSIPPEAFGTPGARVMLHIVPQFQDAPLSDEALLSDTNQRPFVVSARLSKGPSLAGRTEHIKGDFDHKDGNCFLVVPPGASAIGIDTPWGQFEIRKNDAGELSFVEFKCSSTNPQQAMAAFIEAAYPTLDHFAYMYNVAIFVVMIRVFDVTHQSTHLSCTGPFRHQVAVDSENLLFTVMKPVYAMYREAKNADSDFYRFLCFYKIMEGVLGKMRGELFKKAKSDSVILTVERSVVPDEENLSPEFKQYVGKPMQAFFDDVLTANFRDAVAHFLTEDGVLQVSSPETISVYGELALITDLCARTVILSHERLLAQLS